MCCWIRYNLCIKQKFPKIIQLMTLYLIHLYCNIFFLNQDHHRYLIYQYHQLLLLDQLNCSNINKFCKFYYYENHDALFGNSILSNNSINSFHKSIYYLLLFDYVTLVTHYLQLDLLCSLSSFTIISQNLLSCPSTQCLA